MRGSQLAPETLFHEFSDRAYVRATSGLLEDSIDAPGRGTWGRFEAGLGGSERFAPILSLWADIGDVKGWGVRAGFLFGPGRAVVAPQPAMMPPPAPVQAPVTQTCPDGSVILATDVCPAPPPPPPPPPPAPERGF